MQISEQPSLTLILSHGRSLVWWQDIGLFSREMVLYLHLLRTGALQKVFVFSYDAADRDFIAERARDDPTYVNIQVLAPRKGKAVGLAAWWWAVFGAFRHRRTIRQSAAIKTNQVDSCVAALAAAGFSGRPMVVRLGYLLSANYRKSGRTFRSILASGLEGLAFRTARRILVSSRAIARHIATGRPKLASKVMVHPTYVDVDTFHTKTVYEFNGPLLWVGRLTKPKNLPALIEACGLAGRDLDLVGAGELEGELRLAAEKVPITVRFLGRVDNDQLPALIRQYSIFVLPSLWEGLPKALIEAMSCGLVCVASKIPGVDDLIEDGRNGLLIDGFAARDIATVVSRAVKEKNEAMGRRARATVEKDFSLERYAIREASLYAELSA